MRPVWGGLAPHTPVRAANVTDELGPIVVAMHVQKGILKVVAFVRAPDGEGFPSGVGGDQSYLSIHGTSPSLRASPRRWSGCRPPSRSGRCCRARKDSRTPRPACCPGLSRRVGWDDFLEPTRSCADQFRCPQDADAGTVRGMGSLTHRHVDLPSQVRAVAAFADASRTG